MNETPLMVTAYNGNAEVATLLLNNGANVTIDGPNRLTALHYATQSRHVEIVNLLLDHNANVNAKSDIQLTPLMLAAGARFSTEYFCVPV